MCLWWCNSSGGHSNRDIIGLNQAELVTWIYLDDVMNCFLIPQYNNIFFLDNVRMYYSCLIMSPVSDQIHDGHVDVMILYVNVK